MEVIRDQLVKIGMDALTLLIPIVVALLAEYLRRKIGAQRLRRIHEELATKHDLAILGVRFVEQAFKDIHGPEKAKKATEWVVQQATERGISITEQEVNGLVEAALRSIKDEFGDEWGKTVQGGQ